MRQTYASAEKILAQYEATLDNVVEEVLYVTSGRRRRRCATPASLAARAMCPAWASSRSGEKCSQKLVTA